jgi:hypothetical protein
VMTGIASASTFSPAGSAETSEIFTAPYRLTTGTRC